MAERMPIVLQTAANPSAPRQLRRRTKYAPNSRSGSFSIAAAPSSVPVATGRPVAAGTLLGAAAMLKLPLLLFGAYFVLRRNWRGALGFAAVCSTIGILSAIVFGWDFHVRWFELCVRP